MKLQTTIFAKLCWYFKSLQINFQLFIIEQYLQMYSMLASLTFEGPLNILPVNRVIPYNLSKCRLFLFSATYRKRLIERGLKG